MTHLILHISFKSYDSKSQYVYPFRREIRKTQTPTLFSHSLTLARRRRSETVWNVRCYTIHFPDQFYRCSKILLRHTGRADNRSYTCVYVHILGRGRPMLCGAPLRGGLFLQYVFFWGAAFFVFLSCCVKSRSLPSMRRALGNIHAEEAPPNQLVTQVHSRVPGCSGLPPCIP